MRTVTINHERELYVINYGDGCSCLGFDICLAWAKSLADWLVSKGHAVVPPTARGELATYEAYRKLCDAACAVCQARNLTCPVHLTEELIPYERQHVEVVDKYGDTRQFWVGRSSGWAPCHIELSTSRASGGPAAYGTPFTSIRKI